MSTGGHSDSELSRLKSQHQLSRDMALVDPEASWATLMSESAVAPQTSEHIYSQKLVDSAFISLTHSN